MPQSSTTVTTDALLQTDLPLLGRRQGKVRDIYECTLDDGTEALVIIASATYIAHREAILARRDAAAKVG